MQHGSNHFLHPGTFGARAFTIRIGGRVGSGKTALLLELCLLLRDQYNIAVVTNDIFARMDVEFTASQGQDRNVALSSRGETI